MLSFFTSTSFIFGQETNALEKLPPSINTPEYDESAPVISLDGKKLFFTRTGYPDFNRTLIDDNIDLSKTYSKEEYDQKLASIYQALGAKYVINTSTSKLNQDIWYANMEDSLSMIIVHPGYPANNALPNSFVSTGIDSNAYLSINQFFEDGSMYAGFSTIYQYKNGNFSFPEPIHIYNFELKSGDVNLSMSRDGDILVISMRQFDTMGKNDLYFCYRLQPNLYGTPQHMGSVINTNGQETTPYISNNKRRLYFSSDRIGSKGGNDIYYSNRLDYTWKKWSDPKPLGEPFNSTADDSQPFIDEVNEYMYFSSKRDGSSDIFRVSLKEKEEKIYIPPLKIYGQIRNKHTDKLMQAELLYGPATIQGYLEYFSTRTGVFEATIEDGEVFKFYPFKRKFDSQIIHVDASAVVKSGKTDLQLILYLDPQNIDAPVIFLDTLATDTAEVIFADEQENRYYEDGEQIKLEDLAPGRRLSFYNLQFVKSEAIILQKSRTALEEMYRILSTVETLEIVVEGHTDNVGDVQKNIALSQKRAQAVKNYLMNKGIDEDRIQTKGYGPNRPISDNSIESKRQANRRVEIRILKR